MVKKLSENKVSKIFQYLFKGYTQVDIGSRLGITQASVSIHVSQFKYLAQQQGIMAAAKEYNVMDEVQILYDLAVDLKKAKKTVEEASSGLKMVLLFHECGVKEEDYPDLIQACTKMKSDDAANAAVELNQLENDTGKTWKEIVAQAKSSYKDLEQTQSQITSTAAKLKASKEELATIQNQKKLVDHELAAYLKKINVQKKQADQALAAHMKQVGLDMNRLKLVEELAIALKEGPDSDTDLAKYVEHQKLLNQAGLSLENFTVIVKQSKVMTGDDGGKALAEKLHKFGSLDKSIETQKNKLDLLTEKTAGLEEKAKLKAKIETDIVKLKAEQAARESVVAELASAEKKLAKLQHDVTDLFYKREVLIQDIKQKEEHLGHLDDEIADKEHKVSDLSELGAKRSAISAILADLEAKKKLEMTEREVFQSFLSVMGSSLSAEAMEKFIATSPQLLAVAKKGEYSPELLRNFIIKELSGGTLEIWRCISCQARFYVDKPAKTSYTGYQCPSCRSSLVETDVNGPEIIKKALAALPPQVFIVTPTQTPKKTDQNNAGQQEPHH
jgi:predicted transcriptional regulator